MEKYDMIIIGAGIYGLYSAYYCGKKRRRVLVLEGEDNAFSRATYVNQARVHQGYHYPRSISTAAKSAGYFDKFNRDFGFCINRKFNKVYATSSSFSWTDGQQFMKFCRSIGIKCEELNPEKYFRNGMCDAAFLCCEYTYDAKILRDYFLEKLRELDNVTLQFGSTVNSVESGNDEYLICTSDKKKYASGYILNATYASSNQILSMAGFDCFGIKYELCEIILCDANASLREYGFTVMDGPFFSIMPFGKTGMHSLTSVTFTPHSTSYALIPEFNCQKMKGALCSGIILGNCSFCPARPETAFPYMNSLARKYLRDEYDYTYIKSIFSIKPILVSSEMDDSRPTVIRISSQKPYFVSVLSGKINTIYDLDEVLSDE